MAQWDPAVVRKARVTKKEGQALGISVSDGAGVGHCTLITFKDEGAVPDAKVFREGDVILEVDGTYVYDTEHDELLTILIGAFPSFTLTVINEAGDNTLPCLPPPPLPFLHLDCHVAFQCWLFTPWLLLWLARRH